MAWQATNGIISAQKIYFEDVDEYDEVVASGHFTVMRARATSATGDVASYWAWAETGDFRHVQILRTINGQWFGSGVVLAESAAVPGEDTNRMSLRIEGTSITLKDETANTVLCTATDSILSTGYWEVDNGSNPQFTNLGSGSPAATFDALFFGAGL